MTERIAEASPRSKARLAGIFEALDGLTSAFGQVVVLGRLVVAGNAAATAANILGHERLFWLGSASPVIAGASALAELPLQLWLIVMGVNSLRWKEQASVAGNGDRSAPCILDSIAR